MWCVPKLDQEYVERMEDVLDTLAAPEDPDAPVIAYDERPVQLLDSTRAGTPSGPNGRIEKTDYEYKRCGTATVFCIINPKSGEHWTHAEENRKADKFAHDLKMLSEAYPNASTIHLIMDNLNTHRCPSLMRNFGVEEGWRLWKRFTPHYTPKHASWLNPAEIEASAWSRQCLGHRRFPDLASLQRETAAWNEKKNQERRPIKWLFTSEKARKKFGYERVKLDEERN